MKLGTSFKEFGTTLPVTFVFPSNSHIATQSIHQHEPNTRRAEPHSQSESGMGITSEHAVEHPQQEQDNPQNFSDFNKLQQPIPSIFVMQELGQKVDSQKEATQNQLVELNQSSQGQEEMVLLYPTYSDLMGENQELKKWNNDILVENAEVKKELENTKRDKEHVMNQRVKEAEKDFWYKKAIVAADANLKLYQENMVMEERLNVLEEKLNHKMTEVLLLRNQIQNIKNDLDSTKSMEDCYRTFWKFSRMEVRDLERKIKEKDEALLSAEKEKSGVPKQGHMESNLLKRKGKDNGEMDERSGASSTWMNGKVPRMMNN
ncbi:unnamed protein product [Orchesella dallaii]|uniref:Uncharacterized protein n=1 Tax=Orchesella dallaii TaxID=48710 RepID=A0ABP1S724_9HEXA